VTSAVVANDIKGADIVVFWGSQSGTAERFAARLAKEIKQRYGKSALVADMSDYESDSVARIPESKMAIFILSTFGEGDPSDNIHDFWSWIDSKRGKPLSQLRYMAFGLGNSNYKHYNAVIDHVVEKVEKLGAQALLATGRADDVRGETEEHFLGWKDNVLPILKNSFNLEERGPVYEPAIRVTEELNINAATINDGVPLEVATSRATARTMSAVHTLQVKSSHELFKMTGDRNCLHMEIDLSSVTGLKYKTGDHLAIWPINPDAEVAKLVRSLGIATKVQNTVTITTVEGEAKTKLPELTTISAIFNHYLEITAPVSRDVVSSLIEFAPGQAAKDCLLTLSKDARVFSEFTHASYINFGRLLEYADDRAGAWSSLPLSFIIEAMPGMRPRYYSISSSSVVQPRQAAITAVVSDRPLNGSNGGIPGLSTNYLLALNGSLQHTPSAHPRSMSYALDGPRKLLQNGKIYAHIRKSQFKLPTIASRPIIMVGAGTGVAPFRAFLQERVTLLKMGREVGRTILFFGCRNQHQDFIYDEEIQETAEALGARFSLVTAFSRADHGSKTYVQDRVKEHAEEVCDLLTNQDTHFYICGSANMAREVSGVVGSELSKRHGWDEEQLKTFADRQKRSGRWQQDVWS
jgi:NADPH-ferrihemoprotein reductase